MQIFNEITKFWQWKAYSIFKSGLKKNIWKKLRLVCMHLVGWWCLLFSFIHRQCVSVSMWLVCVCVCLLPVHNVNAKLPPHTALVFTFEHFCKSNAMLMDEPWTIEIELVYDLKHERNETKRMCGVIIFALVWISKVVFKQLCANVVFLFFKFSKSFFKFKERSDDFVCFLSLSFSLVWLRWVFVQWIELKSKYAFCN